MNLKIIPIIFLAAICVVPCFAWITGDVNHDGKVDMKDIVTVAKTFGATPSDPRWNVNCDLNGDHIVNTKDLGIACKYFGQRS